MMVMTLGALIDPESLACRHYRGRGQQAVAGAGDGGAGIQPSDRRGSPVARRQMGQTIDAGFGGAQACPSPYQLSLSHFRVKACCHHLWARCPYRNF